MSKTKNIYSLIQELKNHPDAVAFTIFINDKDNKLECWEQYGSSTGNSTLNNIYTSEKASQLLSDKLLSMVPAWESMSEFYSQNKND